MIYVVYKHYDKDGRLLYVGATGEVLKRTSLHQSSSAWFESVANIVIEKFEYKSQALDYERKVIFNEKPLYNVKIPANPNPLTRTYRADKTKKDYGITMNKLLSKYKTIPKISALLGVSRQVVEQWCKRKSVPFKVGDLIEQKTGGKITRYEIWEAAGKKS